MKRLLYLAFLTAAFFTACGANSDSLEPAADGDVDADVDNDISDPDLVVLKGTSYGGGNAQEVMLSVVQGTHTGGIVWSELALSMEGIQTPVAPQCRETKEGMLRGEAPTIEMDLAQKASRVKLLLPPDKDFCGLSLIWSPAALTAHGRLAGVQEVILQLDLHGRLDFLPEVGHFHFGEGSISSLLVAFEGETFESLADWSSVTPDNDGVLAVRSGIDDEQVVESFNRAVSASFSLWFDPDSDGKIDAGEEKAGHTPEQPEHCRRLVVSPRSLDYGNVQLGQRQDLVLTISNNCEEENGESVTIFSISSDCEPPALLSEFSLVIPMDLPLELLPGESIQVVVGFTPIDIGQDNCAITIISNALQSCNEDSQAGKCKIDFQANAIGESSRR